MTPKDVTIKTRIWCVVWIVVFVGLEVAALNGPNVCMVKQKYNITKRVKYRAPMSVRTYVWCFSVPPRCSKWSTEMRDLTRLETEERTAEVAVCCPGYKMKDVSCVPICPSGKTGPGCSEDCPDNKWGPNCVNECKKCKNGFCSPITGDCECLGGWQGESCDASMPTTTTSTMTLEELLTTLTNKLPPPITTPKVVPTRAMQTTTMVIHTTVPVLSTTMATVSTEITTTSTTKRKPTTPMVTYSSSIPTSTTLATTTKIMETTTSPKDIKMMTKTTSTPMKMKTITMKTDFVKNINKDLITSTESMTTIKPFLATEAYFNTTPASPVTAKGFDMHTKDGKESTINPIGTEVPLIPQISKNVTLIAKNLHLNKAIELVKDFNTTTDIPKPTNSPPVFNDASLKTTIKFKPKEIWIRPAQKGDSPIVETKIKTVNEPPRYRSVNAKDSTPDNTTPKTIIVSIIPTSVSYSTFKKIALTTASYLFTKNTSSVKSYNKIDHEYTTEMVSSTTPKISAIVSSTTINSLTRPTIRNVSKEISSTSDMVPSSTIKSTVETKSSLATLTFSLSNKTNSMVADVNTKSNSSSVTVPSTNAASTTSNVLIKVNASNAVEKSTKLVKDIPKKHETLAASNKNTTKTNIVTLKDKVTDHVMKKTNSTKVLTRVTTDAPTEDEEFHILTEPEHITAVMGDKSAERSSVDLVSVISIAGGVMMAVITVAVVIVMVERCKKPRYEDVRKVNDIRMQVMIENEAPPPYVRSIFHTPLPDPPSSVKCHYQPISTLDRNVKQFMRPVVVQTISPVMLENFRGILECHYDHLPRRSHDFETIQTRCSIAPSIRECGELNHFRTSLSESTIEAMKCEAKLDVIDSTTSEPLYAEIPCWRPPSEHAIEIMNLNGEAVTEL